MCILAMVAPAACGRATSDQTNANLIAAHAPEVTEHKLQITCHEMLGGAPEPDVTTYEVRGDSLYVIDSGGVAKIISVEGKQTNLGRHVDERGPEDSFATHILRGHDLTRTVFWQRPGEAQRQAFTEKYDFDQQTVTDGETGEDSCHHNAKSRGRTEDQAVREGLESLRNASD